MNLENIPEAKVVKNKFSFSIVWIIPVIALAIAIYIGYQSWQNRGEIVEIEFTNGSGLEIGKTKVKYKDVEVGKVIGISLAKNLQKVKVRVAIDREIAKELHGDSNFWVVRPRVTTRTVSGIGTLLSGAYISLSVGSDKKNSLKKNIIGLDEPPTLSGLDNGYKFSLEAERLGSTDIGTPIFYRGMAVGEVVSYKLLDNQKMSIQIFIKTPYDYLIDNKTSFWNLNGLDIRFGSNGVEAHLESFLSFMQGGIAFENLSGQGEKLVEKDNQNIVFKLYQNQDSITKIEPINKLNYIMLFSDGVSGLQEGANLKHKGLIVGTVKKIVPRFNHDKFSVEIPVLVEIWSEKFAIQNDENSTKIIEQMIIKKGLRGKLKTANLLTGQMEIDLTFIKNRDNISLKKDGNYLVFPTVETDIEQLLQRVDSVMAKLENAPLNEMIEELHKTTKNISKIIDINDKNSIISQTNEAIKNLNKILINFENIPKDIKYTLEQSEITLQKLNKTLEAGEKNLKDDSILQHDIRNLLQEVTRAATAIEGVADTLQRKPNSIIFGKD